MTSPPALPSISVITAVYNRARTLEACLASVREQTHPAVEHVIVDGGSTDGSLEILRAHAAEFGPWVSEPDLGLYDAVNKGLRLATGEVVGVLGADDVYADERVLAEVATALQETRADACYGDLLYVRDDDPERVVRTWRSAPYRPGLMARGWMPPHPTFFVRRELHERLGYYNVALKIAADYELMLRFLQRYGVRATYVPRVLVRMRTGGMSNSVGNLVRKSYEDWRAWRLQGFGGGLGMLARKNLSKLPQFLHRDQAGTA